MGTLRSEVIRSLGLERHVFELEADGLTVVPPEVHGVDAATIDAMADFLLRRSGELVGCGFTLDGGPDAELEFPSNATGIGDGQGPPNQFLIYQLASAHRMFRDLALNPVALALIRYMIGHRATRFSSHNAFVKWQGEHGYGENLGLHADQTAVPLPWGRDALTANTNWCLTDYTLDGGCFAYVPGSHRTGHRPVFPDARRRAVPVECPKGSVIVFHGAVWHGAFPRRDPGMRLSVANYYRHMMVTSQEEFRNAFDQRLAEDCADPALFRQLAGFSDVFPYAVGTGPLPQVVGRRDSA